MGTNGHTTEKYWTSDTSAQVHEHGNESHQELVGVFNEQAYTILNTLNIATACINSSQQHRSLYPCLESIRINIEGTTRKTAENPQIISIKSHFHKILFPIKFI